MTIFNNIQNYDYHEIGLPQIGLIALLGTAVYYSISQIAIPAYNGTLFGKKFYPASDYISDLSLSETSTVPSTEHHTKLKQDMLDITAEINLLNEKVQLQIDLLVTNKQDLMESKLALHDASLRALNMNFTEPSIMMRNLKDSYPSTCSEDGTLDSVKVEDLFPKISSVFYGETHYQMKDKYFCDKMSLMGRSANSSSSDDQMNNLVTYLHEALDLGSKLTQSAEVFVFVSKYLDHVAQIWH